MDKVSILPVYFALDPAIDRNKIDEDTALKYVTSRDPELLQHGFVEGQKPVTYHLRPIPRSLRTNYLATAPNEYALNERAFRCAVIRVANLGHIEGDWTPAHPEPAADKSWIMTDAELDHIDVSDLEVQDIGSVARLRAFLPRWTEDGFQPSPSLVSAWGIRSLAYRKSAGTPTPQTSSASASPRDEVPQSRSSSSG